MRFGREEVGFLVDFGSQWDPVGGQKSTFSVTNRKKGEKNEVQEE